MDQKGWAYYPTGDSPAENPREALNIEVGESFLGGPQQMEVKNLKPCYDYRICRYL